jgi:hypothetical protein
MRVAPVILGFALGVSALAGDGDRVPLGDVAERAVQQSKLTLPGSKPFHLKAEIVETTNPSSEYQAKVEQYWVSPTQWRRMIECPGSRRPWSLTATNFRRKTREIIFLGGSATLPRR